LIARGKVDEDVAIWGVAVKVAFEGFAVDFDSIEFALEAFFEVGEGLDEVVALRFGFGVFLRGNYASEEYEDTDGGQEK